jgi:N-acetylneuraminic acid mutarotase
MKKLIVLLCVVLFALAAPGAERKWGPLPIAVANNAVAAAKVDKQLFLFSFMGVGDKKDWKSITNRLFGLNTETGKWIEYRAVPGPAGRLGASAVLVKDVIYLIGGYTLDNTGATHSVSSVEVLLPQRNIWYRGQDMPIPLDDSVVGVYKDRFIYTVSGWSGTDAVKTVQMYDAEKNTWGEATPIPGTPVFGHAGALVDDTIVYIDGARKNAEGATPAYLTSDECWMGKIDHHDPSKITWTKIANHPGKARYRMAAGGSEHDNRVYFSGGSEELHKYDGTYDDHLASPSPMTFAWNLKTSKWEVVSEKTPDPTMDNRGLLVAPQGLVRIGGIEADGKVTAKVNVSPRAGK